jgi:hypothetical protein
MPDRSKERKKGQNIIEMKFGAPPQHSGAKQLTEQYSGELLSGSGLVSPLYQKSNEDLKNTMWLSLPT